MSKIKKIKAVATIVLTFVVASAILNDWDNFKNGILGVKPDESHKNISPE